MLIKILLVLGALIALLFVLAALQPSDFRVTRSVTIAAPPAVVFSKINDLHIYQTWNPWGKFDPQAAYSHSGSPAGAGASLAWAGNSQIGEGRLTITDSRPNELVRMKLEFIKPFASAATADFTLAGGSHETAVTWSMFGPKNFMSKLIGLFMNMDKMIGGQFEDGLASLKTLSESPTK